MSRRRKSKRPKNPAEPHPEPVAPGAEIGSSLGLESFDRPTEAEVVVPGSAPGIEKHPEVNLRPAAGSIKYRCIDYGMEAVVFREFPDLESYLAAPRPAGCSKRWLNIDGVSAYVVNQLRQRYNFHTLAAEDVLNLQQRPKIDAYEGYLYLSTRMLMLQGDHLHNEQVSVFYFPDLLITIQEETGDMWDPIRERLKVPGSRLRTHDTAFLLYALLDALVDHLFPVLERYGDILEDLEHEAMARPEPQVQQRILGIRRELVLLRRVMWPIRELVDVLYRDEKRGLAPQVKPYLRDVYDHCVQVIDLVETYREMAAGLTDLYMSAVSNRMNEIMKVLTLLATFFIPTTFLAGVYGMNFRVFPELQWKYGYLCFWLLCLAITGALAVFFYRKGWFGKPRPRNEAADPGDDS